MYWRQTSALLDSNFIQNYEYFVICTLWLMYLHPLYFTDARTLKYEDIPSHPYSPAQEYSRNTELLLSCPCSNSLSTIFPLRCIPLNSLWESFFLQCFQSVPVVIQHTENRLISYYSKVDCNCLKYIKIPPCSSKPILRGKKVRISVLLYFSLIVGGSVFKAHTSF